MDEQDNTTEELVTIAGGVDMEVDYSNNGSKETIRVMQIPISKISAFLTAWGDEGALIELYCDKPKGWADTLALQSASAIADKGQELNLPFLGAWLKRQAKWREVQAQGMTQEEKARLKLMTESRSDSSPPVSPITTT